MACYHPLNAWADAKGEVLVLKQGMPHPASFYRYLGLPCGRCVGCRLEYTRQWGVRILHEAKMHDFSWFVTLTYDEAKVPPELRHEDFRAFMKRLRRKVPSVRYFMCGEYGERFGRPHFHAVLFGLPLSDLRVIRDNVNGKLYSSAFLDSVWQNGYCSVGSVTFESASYCASYVMKKAMGLSAAAADSRFSGLDLTTGELLARTPEYCRMSLKPGIGYEWFQKYGYTDVLPHDRVVVNGYEGKPPRYYDKIARGLKSREDRAVRGALHEVDNTAARLLVRESVTRGRLKLKRRSL